MVNEEAMEIRKKSLGELLGTGDFQLRLNSFQAVVEAKGNIEVIAQIGKEITDFVDKTGEASANKLNNITFGQFETAKDFWKRNEEVLFSAQIWEQPVKPGKKTLTREGLQEKMWGINSAQEMFGKSKAEAEKKYNALANKELEIVFWPDEPLVIDVQKAKLMYEEIRENKNIPSELKEKVKADFITQRDGLAVKYLADLEEEHLTGKDFLGDKSKWRKWERRAYVLENLDLFPNLGTIKRKVISQLEEADFLNWVRENLKLGGEAVINLASTLGYAEAFIQGMDELGFTETDLTSLFLNCAFGEFAGELGEIAEKLGMKDKKKWEEEVRKKLPEIKKNGQLRVI